MQRIQPQHTKHEGTQRRSNIIILTIITFKQTQTQVLHDHAPHTNTQNNTNQNHVTYKTTDYHKQKLIHMRMLNTLTLNINRY